VLRDPSCGEALGNAGREHVRERFLTPRLLLDWLHVLEEMA